MITRLFKNQSRKLDGEAELLLHEYVVDHNGRLVLRDDYEALEELREILREQARREEYWRPVLHTCAIILTVIALGTLFKFL